MKDKNCVSTAKSRKWEKPENTRYEWSLSLPLRPGGINKKISNEICKGVYYREKAQAIEKFHCMESITFCNIKWKHISKVIVNQLNFVIRCIIKYFFQKYFTGTD